MKENPLPQIISREAAHRAGERKFFTGEACKSGHVAPRYVSNGACIECINKKFKFRRNIFSRDLVPYVSQKIWVPRTIPLEEYPQLDKYLVQCVREYARHAGKLTPELDEAMLMQIERM